MKSVWKWNINDLQVTGNYSTVVHYYEDGNVQLNSNKKAEFSLAKSDVCLLAFLTFLLYDCPN